MCLIRIFLEAKVVALLKTDRPLETPTAGLTMPLGAQNAVIDSAVFALIRTVDER